MSKTDKTKPPWVRIVLRDVPFREVHNHENGICDIEGLKFPNAEHIDSFRGRCYWTWWYDGVNYFCGCKMCTEQFERKRKNKRRRQESKKIIREQLEDQ